MQSLAVPGNCLLETLGGLKLICLAFAYVKMFNFMTTSGKNPEVIDVQLAFI